MVDGITVVIKAVKFGYKRHGPKGAVAAAIAVGASYVVIARIVPKFTNVNEDRIDEIYEKVSDDNELANILGEEFTKRFGDYFDDDDGMAGAATTP